MYGRLEVRPDVTCERQGDTHAEALDPELCFVDRVGETLVKAPGDIRHRDFVLSRLRYGPPLGLPFRP